MREIILGYQGEMSLKGLNRNQFETALMKILRYRLKTVGKFRVYCTQSTFYMEPEEDGLDMDLAFERVSKVFGLAALSRAVVCEKDFDTICQTAEAYLGDDLRGIRTFKVEARRADKSFPMTSPELAEIEAAEAAMPGLAQLEAEAAEQTDRLRIRITDEVGFEG